MSPRRLLFHHFLRQHASFEGVATGGEAKYVVIAVVSLLAGPGYLTAVMAAHGAALLALVFRGRLPPELWLWKEEWLLFAVSLVTVATLTAVQWRSFVLGGRDYRILGILPLARRAVMSAKLQSLVVVVLLLHAAINTLPGMWLPLASPFGYTRAALALQVALLLQTVFACAAVVGVQGLVSLLLPPPVARRVSAAFQAAILLAAALLFVAEGSISRFAFAMREVAHPVQWLVPVAWFRAAYVQLLGVDTALVASQARLAWLATGVALALAVPCSLLGFRDTGGEGLRHGRGLPAATGPLERVLWRRERPLARAVASFTRAALFRSASAGLVGRGAFLLGLALTLSGFIGLALADIGYRTPVLPARPLHAPVFVLPFFALVGLRLAAVYPAELGAHWIFRLTEKAGSSDYAAGVRRAAHALVLPLLGVLAVPYALLLGPREAAGLLGLALAVALVTAEWLFLGFPKVPFTCTYQPGKANLRVTWPKHAAIFVAYCGVVPALAVRLLASPRAWAASVILLLVAWLALRRRRDREARETPLVFDDAAHPRFTLLGLDRYSGPVRVGVAPRRPAVENGPLS